MMTKPVEITHELRTELLGKRIGALDYGQKRIGFAVCDELHIIASPRGFFASTLNLMSELQSAFERERVGAIIIGMPFQHDNTETPMMREIHAFMNELRLHTTLPMYVVDEAYSSREARQTMIRSGKKKSHRAEKGRTDEVAAALVLREFLRELE